MLRLHNTYLMQCCYAANAYEGLTYYLGNTPWEQALFVRGLRVAQNLPPIAAHMTEDLAWR